MGSHGLMGLGEVHSCGRHSRQRIALHDLSGASGFAPLSGQQLCDRNKINRIKAQPGSDRGQLVRRHNLKTLRELRKIFEANIPDYADMQFKLLRWSLQGNMYPHSKLGWCDLPKRGLNFMSHRGSCVGPGSEHKSAQKVTSQSHRKNRHCQ